MSRVSDFLESDQHGKCPVFHSQRRDLVAGASIKGMPDYIKAVAEREKSIAF